MFINNILAAGTCSKATLPGQIEVGAPDEAIYAFDGLALNANFVAEPLPPSNIKLGLVGMGQVLLMSNAQKNLQIAYTTGCGPCLGVAVTYTENQTSLAILAHLQPETDYLCFAENIRSVLPDNLGATVQLHITTAMSEVFEIAQQQRSSVERLVSQIASKYDYILFDDDNVFLHNSFSLSIEIASLKVSISPVGNSEFSGTDLDYMEAQMKRNAASLRYFKLQRSRNFIVP